MRDKGHKTKIEKGQGTQNQNGPGTEGHKTPSRASSLDSDNSYAPLIFKNQFIAGSCCRVVLGSVKM